VPPLGVGPAVDEEEVLHALGVGGVVGGVDCDHPTAEAPAVLSLLSLLPPMDLLADVVLQRCVPVAGAPQGTAEASGDGGGGGAGAQDGAGEGLEAASGGGQE
jgi:hypothetical protein